MVTGQEKYNSCFLVIQTFHDMQCAKPFTHCLTSFLNLGQNNCSRTLNRVLYSPMWPSLGPSWKCSKTILLSYCGMTINATYRWFARISLQSTNFPFKIWILPLLRSVLYPGMINFKWDESVSYFLIFKCSLISYPCHFCSCMFLYSLIFLGT